MTPDDKQSREYQEENPEKRAKDAADAPPEAVAGAAAEAGVAEQIEKLTVEKQELANMLVRRQADFENFRKRIEKERHQESRRAAESVVEHLLPILDAFDRALAGDHKSAHGEYRKGFELIRRQMWDVLSREGLRRIEAAGKEFDPQVHHAIERVESADHPDGTVIDELQPGYLFHERVLRPAMVRVSAEPEPKSAHTGKPAR